MPVKKYKSILFLVLILAFSVLLSQGAGFSLSALAEDFSSSIEGATGWGTTTLAVYWTDSSDSSRIEQIPAKEPFRILSRYSDDMLQVEYNGMTGYVKTDYVLINLPDVEPDIIYNLTNATGSIFTATTERGTVNQKLDLYGTQIYYNGDTAAYYNSDTYSRTAGSRAGKIWNSKLGKYEFAVPILFTAAEKISKARTLALADGYDFKIYDAYRPNTATQLMNTSFNSLYGQTGSALHLAGYNTSFYVASALSAHNIGCAIDLTMVQGSEEAEMPTQMHVLSGDAVLLNYSDTGRTAHELYGQPYDYYDENFANTMTEDARRLCWYMIHSGMTGLGSEWWHYQDQRAYSRNRGFYPNLATWYPCQLCSSTAFGDISSVPDIVTRRAEAVYQLWAAAGFPIVPGDISFTDVTPLDYYYNAIRWAVSTGILSGSSSSTFSPNDAITRAGFLDMLFRYCGGRAESSVNAAAGQPDPQNGASGENTSGTSVFTDVSPNAWYYDAVQWATGLGITDAAAGAFSPSGVLTQAQMHLFLTRASAAGIALSQTYL